MKLTDDRDQQARLRERFTRTAEAFGDFVLSKRGAEADRLAGLLGLHGHELGADLACGPGTLAIRFAPRVRWMCGVDLTPAMLSRARKVAAENGVANLDLVLGDAQLLPFAERSLDLVVTSYSFHHISDPPRVLREMHRVLKPGGRVGLLDIIVPEDTRAAEKNNAIEHARDASHVRTFPKTELEAILQAAGFRIQASESGTQSRSFDHWLSVAGWRRGDRAYDETRRLMEATLADDGAGFHPRLGAASGGEGPDIEFVQTTLFLAGAKE